MIKDPRVLAKYPFLPEALQSIKDERMDDIFESADFRRARELGLARVEDSLGNEEDFVFIDERNSFDLIVSFFIAKAIVLHINDNYLSRRHAIFEAKRSYHYLERETRETVDAVARSLGIRREGSSVHFTTYLRYAPNNYGPWKLTNSRLSGGMVEVDDHSFIRMVQEAVRIRVEEMGFANEYDVSKVMDLSSVYAELSSRKIAQNMVYDIDEKSFPPCMKNIMAQIASSINVSHAGRFALTTFLNGIGMKEEEIMRALMPVPDFNDSVARYQVEHITGKSSGKKYSTPSCDTMRTYGICFQPDELCARIKHPMQYYERKVSDENRRVPAGKV
jgi:DNA primase large subunit